MTQSQKSIFHSWNAEIMNRERSKNIIESSKLPLMFSCFSFPLSFSHIYWKLLCNIFIPLEPNYERKHILLWCRVKMGGKNDFHTLLESFWIFFMVPTPTGVIFFPTASCIFSHFFFFPVIQLFWYSFKYVVNGVILIWKLVAINLQIFFPVDFESQKAISCCHFFDEVHLIRTTWYRIPKRPSKILNYVWLGCPWF